ncbi:DUF3156 family protein [Aquitalea aquatilis]|uniref:DUF3156 family protein n=1 Tax=Aquitalea aquatilis TaxID=1537400 RepID=UPI0010BD55F7|nr:DUF3156 family protein [Aquitalea aquatilis]
MWQRALDFALRPRLPKGYRPGVTLARLERELSGLDYLGEEDGQRRYALPGSHWSVLVSEVVDSQLLLHTVSCRFSLQLALAGPAQPCRLAFRHRGSWRRSGIACHLLRGDASELAALRQQLEQDADLHTALMPLDFKRCELLGDAAGWRVEIEPFAASEVVGRFPPFRRYIRLITTQKLAVLASMAALRRLLLAQDGPPLKQD